MAGKNPKVARPIFCRRGYFFFFFLALGFWFFGFWLFGFWLFGFWLLLAFGLWPLLAFGFWASVGFSGCCSNLGSHIRLRYTTILGHNFFRTFHTFMHSRWPEFPSLSLMSFFTSMPSRGLSPIMHLRVFQCTRFQPQGKHKTVSAKTKNRKNK